MFVGIISIFFSGRVQKLEQRVEKLQIMAPSYIHTEKALSALFPVMPITLSDVASSEENACDFKMPCKSLIQGTLYISYHTLQAHSIEVTGVTFRENTT